MIQLTIRGGGTYTGRTIETIIRREYGPKAEFWPNRDPNGPEAGMIVSPVPYEDLGAYNILAEVLAVEETTP